MHIISLSIDAVVWFYWNIYIFQIEKCSTWCVDCIAETGVWNSIIYSMDNICLNWLDTTVARACVCACVRASERWRKTSRECICGKLSFSTMQMVYCVMYLANTLDAINQITKQLTLCWNFFSIACAIRGMACDRDWNMDFCQLPHSLFAMQFFKFFSPWNWKSKTDFSLGRAENGEKHPVGNDNRIIVDYRHDMRTNAFRSTTGSFQALVCSV